MPVSGPRRQGRSGGWAASHGFVAGNILEVVLHVFQSLVLCFRNVRGSNTMAPTPSTANTKNGLESPIAASNWGQPKPTMKSTVHTINADAPLPRPRIFSGLISDNTSQLTGEMAPCWKARKVTVKARITKPRPIPLSRTSEKKPISSRAAFIPTEIPAEPGNSEVLPAGAFRHEVHPHPQRDRGQRGDDEHSTTESTGLTKSVAEIRVEDEGQQLPGDDHQLGLRDDAPAPCAG